MYLPRNYFIVIYVFQFLFIFLVVKIELTQNLFCGALDLSSLVLFSGGYKVETLVRNRLNIPKSVRFSHETLCYCCCQRFLAKRWINTIFISFYFKDLHFNSPHLKSSQIDSLLSTKEYSNGNFCKVV